MDEERYFEQIAEYKLLAKHEVGQNFLIDKSVAKRIVALAELKETDKALEIGSGAGSLSYYIAESPSESDLIDIDEALVLKLQNDFAGLKNVHPQMGNIMDWMGVYGHNIFIDDSLVGYISSNGEGGAILFISGHKFAEMDEQGQISINGTPVGYIDDGGDVYLHDRYVGEVDATNDVRFYGAKLKN